MEVEEVPLETVEIDEGDTNQEEKEERVDIEEGEERVGLEEGEEGEEREEREERKEEKEEKGKEEGKTKTEKVKDFFRGYFGRMRGKEGALMSFPGWKLVILSGIASFLAIFVIAIVHSKAISKDDYTFVIGIFFFPFQFTFSIVP